MFCRNCGKEVSNNEEFCDECKEKQAKSTMVICPYCGKETSKSEQFCQHCEGFLKKPQPTQKTTTTRPNTQETKTCKACGSKIPKKSVYCPNCHKLADATPYIIPKAQNQTDIIGFLLGFFLGATGMIITLCLDDDSTRRKSAVKGFVVSILVTILITLLVTCGKCIAAGGLMGIPRPF